MSPGSPGWTLTDVDQVDLDGAGERGAAALAEQVAHGAQRALGAVDGYEQLFHGVVAAALVRGSRAAGGAIMPVRRPWALTRRNPRPGPAGASEHVGGVVGQARALAARQRDVPGMRPALEAVDDVGEA